MTNGTEAVRHLFYAYRGRPVFLTVKDTSAQNSVSEVGRLRPTTSVGQTSAVHLREFVARLPVADLAEFRIVEFFIAVRTPSRILRRRATVWAVVLASQPHHADAAMHS